MEQTEALFHVARESLANVRRHAAAHSVTARLERSHGGFRMMITDDGKGFDSAEPNTGLGLRNIRERISTLGGQIDIRTAASRGTEVTVDLPLRVKE